MSNFYLKKKNKEKNSSISVEHHIFTQVLQTFIKPPVQSPRSCSPLAMAHAVGWSLQSASTPQSMPLH